MRNFQCGLYGLMMIAALAGCGPVLRSGTLLPDILAQDEAEYDGPYRVSPGDQIDIHHILDPDYSAVAAIAPDGRLTVPGLKQQVDARGRTLAELAETVNGLYRSESILSRPFFSLSLRSSASLQVFVAGEVQRPGYLDLGGGERHLLQVIASAGGFLPTARLSEVIILRSPPSAKPQVFSVNVRRIISGTDLAQNVRIHPLDVVLVPRSDIASLDVWIDQYIRQALPVPGSVSATFTNNPSAALLK